MLPPVQVVPPSAQPKYEPGALEALSRWFDQGAANFRKDWLGAKERMDDFNQQASTAGKSIGDGALDATKNAVGAVVALPIARAVQGRQVCATAPNGAPDCQAAAEILCKAKGFTTGKSIDFTSSQRCPARVWAAGRQGNEAECTTETFISRAMCQ